MHIKIKKLNPKMDPLQWTAASKPMHNINNTNHNSNSNNSNGNDNNNKGRVLRFEFSNAMIESTMAFTEVHRYDDRKTYKEAWAQWLAHDEIAAMIKSEVERLTNLGYKGDVADKLFKSGRYYFRQKTYGFPNLSLHAEPLGVRGALAPRKYVTMGRELLHAMDDHIERGLRHDAYTPAIGFSDFFKTHASSDLLKTAVAGLMRHYDDGANAPREIHEKLKKTYKNRYFMMVQNDNAAQNDTKISI
jgi:hypothetical protein